jgi:hypothetical protein
MRRIVRIGVPVVTAAAAVLISTQGASAATATPNHLLPKPPCVQVQPGPGAQVPAVSQNDKAGGVEVTKPGPGKPGQPGTCVVCGTQVKVGSGHVMPMRKPVDCAVCVVQMRTGNGQDNPGQVTSSGGGTVSVSGRGGDRGPVTVGTGQGGVVVGVGGPGPFCPVPQHPLTKSGSSHR